MKPLPGDAVFYPVTPRSDWASKFVAIGEMFLRMGKSHEMFSHVALLDRDTAYQLEAYWPRTRRSRIDQRRPYEVWRLKGESTARRKLSLYWAYENLGQWYNLLGILFGWMKFRFHNRYCSEFARSAKRAAGFHLPDDVRGYFSPNQLADFYKKHGFKVYENSGVKKEK